MYLLGTRVQGNAGVYSGKKETSKAVSDLKKGLENHSNAKILAKMAIKTLAVSNPYIEGLVLGTELAFAAYKGLKIYKETGDLKNALITVGIETAKTLSEDLIFGGAVRTASNIIVPSLVEKLAGNSDPQQMQENIKIIKKAIEVSAEALT